MRLATAKGSWGTSADYLFRICDALQARGIEDPAIDHPALEVATALAKYPDPHGRLTKASGPKPVTQASINIGARTGVPTARSGLFSNRHARMLFPHG